MGWGKYVLGGKHQYVCFQLGMDAKRYMNCHLVTVKVCVEGRTHKRMKLYGFSIHKDWLKGLYGHTVEGGCPVEQYRMLFYHFF